MGTIGNAFKREIGKNIGKTVSNALFGDSWSTPYRRTNSRAAETRAEARAKIDEARAAAISKRDLNAIDAAVLRNVDAVIGEEFGENSSDIIRQISSLIIQVNVNSFKAHNAEQKVRTKYTLAVLNKISEGIQILEYLDPLNTQLNHLTWKYLKAKWRKIFSLRISWGDTETGETIVLFLVSFSFIVMLGCLGAALEKHDAEDVFGPILLILLAVILGVIILKYIVLALALGVHKIKRKIIYRRYYAVAPETASQQQMVSYAVITNDTKVEEETEQPVQSEKSVAKEKSHYRSEFVDLMNDPRWQGAYIGQGNPNSKVLIVGREHGFDNDDQRILEIDKNWEQWKKIIAGDESTQNDYSPRHCYADRGQKFRIAPTNGGTSATWYVYQRMVNALIPHNLFQEKLDFFEYSFITEFSTVNRCNNSNNTEADVQATAYSIAERTPLLSSAFYRSFPIVIISCGDYFDRYHINIEKMFDVKWEGPTREVELGNGKKAWLNMHYSADRKRIVIHTWQASAFTHDKEETYQPFFKELARLCGNV